MVIYPLKMVIYPLRMVIFYSYVSLPEGIFGGKNSDCESVDDGMEYYLYTFQ